MRQIFIFLAILFYSVFSSAQEKFIFSFQGEYGLVGGKESFSNYGSGSVGSFGFGALIGEKGAMAEVNIFFQDTNVDLKDHKEIPYSVYAMNLLGGWSYRGFPSVCFNLKLGGFVGMERINKGFNFIREGIYRGEEYVFTFTDEPTEKMVCGLTIKPEIEIPIYRSFSGIISFSQHFNLVSEYSKSIYELKLGIKIQI